MYRHKTPTVEDLLQPEEDKHAVEKRIMEEVMGRGGVKGAKGNKNVPPRKKSSGGGVDLMATMAARLSKLEVAHRTLKAEMVKKDKEIYDLKKELRLATESMASDGAPADKCGGSSQPLSKEESEAKADIINSAHERVLFARDSGQARIEAENKKLREQVAEMEKFLTDYGLIWVGQEGFEIDNNVKDELGRSLRAEIDFAPDFDLLMSRFEELNVLAGSGQAKVVLSEGPGRGGQMAKLSYDEGLPLSVYKDGLLIRRGPFRSFTDANTQGFVRDVLDGYFPAEFREQYPDGIIFDVVDKRNLEYLKASKLSDGSGENNRPPAQAGANAASLSSVGPAGMHLPMTGEEFLKRLPDKVIHKGTIVPVREEIAERLGMGPTPAQSSLNTVVVHTAALKTTASSSSLSQEPCSGGPSPVTTLQVRVGGGAKKLVVKMFYHNTIKELTSHLEQHVDDAADTHVLRTAFPPKVYTDPSETLEHAGLVPNATLFYQSAS